MCRPCLDPDSDKQFFKKYDINETFGNSDNDRYLIILWNYYSRYDNGIIR